MKKKQQYVLDAGSTSQYRANQILLWWADPILWKLTDITGTHDCALCSAKHMLMNYKESTCGYLMLVKV